MLSGKNLTVSVQVELQLILHCRLGDPTLRTYNASSFAQQAVTFLCLDFNGVSTKFNELPAQSCPSGIRAQIVRTTFQNK